MSSKIISVRLNTQEQSILSILVSRGGKVGDNPFELFRVLLWREYYRRTEGTSKAPVDVYSDMRSGRPATNCHTLSLRKGQSR